jgi:hypothetical protein
MLLTDATGNPTEIGRQIATAEIHYHFRGWAIGRLENSVSGYAFLFGPRLPKLQLLYFSTRPSPSAFVLP